jgi:hypothetical protein
MTFDAMAANRMHVMIRNRNNPPPIVLNIPRNNSRRSKSKFIVMMKILQCRCHSLCT